MRISPLAPTVLLALLTSAGCMPAPAPAKAPQVSAATPATPAAEGDQQGAPKQSLPWATFEPATFARARAEHKLVLLDGAAEWCHWCHVMEATTYHDPAVRKLLDEHFIAAKVDVDSRPDIEERYGDYGWPATVLFSADGKELGKYRGYIAPDAFAEILSTAVESPNVENADAAANQDKGAPKGVLTEDELAFAERFTQLDLDEFYDKDQGGWGRWQKAAVAMDNAWALLLARQGDATAKEHVLFTLDKQRAILDPVWGGIYQYSAAQDWNHPHFEKLMTFQSGALSNYAEAYALTHDPKWLDVAKAMRGYIDHFLTSSEGGFYATQDADLNAHEMGKRFMTGHEYYAKSDAERRALGIPRVDTHEYGMENGLAIAAYVTLSQAANDATALTSAEKAAKRILSTHGAKDGGITHDAGEKGDRIHLADNAAFGLGLMRLYEATKSAQYADAAVKVGDAMLRDLEDKEKGGFFAASADPDAVGVFAVRRKPFEDNVTALRFFARLAHLKPTDARYPVTIEHALRTVTTPDAIKGRGRMLGDYLVALEETRGVRKTPTQTPTPTQ